jgi:CarD family transcriptional regulator
MFKKGDSAVYPHHGAGIIESVQEKSILSEKRRYYVLKLSLAELIISVPVDNCHELGLRTTINKPTAKKVLNSLTLKAKTKLDDSNERFRMNNDKIGSGDVFAIAEVVRELSKINEISTREKRMLGKAKTILVSELMHSFKKSEEEVVKQIDKILN